MPIKTTLLPLMTCSALWLAGCGDSSTDPADLPEGTPPADATSTDSDAASLIDNATKEAKQTADQVVDQANRAAEDATDAVNNAVEQSEQAVDDVKQQANDAVEEVNRSARDAQKSVADALKPKQNSQDGQGDLGGLLNNRGGFGLPGQTRQVEEDADERTTVRGVSFVMPEGWRVGPPKTMRLLTLLPPQDFNDADLAVSKWPGDVGGFAANVTRWARQAGTTPKSLKRADYPQITVDGKDAAWIKLVGEGGGNAILAVWVPRGENLDRPTETWTFKLTCKADQVDKLEAAVKAWAESVKFE